MVRLALKKQALDKEDIYGKELIQPAFAAVVADGAAIGFP